MHLVAQTDFSNLLNEVKGNAGSLCAMLVVGVIIVFALGIVLKSAISLYNSLCGGKDAADGVPAPTMIGSMIMVTIAAVISYVLAVATVWAAASLAFSTNLNPAQAAYYAGMAAIPIAFVVLSIILALFLPAPIFRAGLIALLCVPVAIVLFILFTVILWIIFAALNITFPAFQGWKK